MDRATLKKNLEQEMVAQAQIFSEWKQEGGEHNFEVMESKALEIGQTVARALLSYGIGDEQQVERQERPEADPSCPKCGRRMRYGGQPSKKIESKAGEIGFSRDYYHCPACQAGLFPPR